MTANGRTGTPRWPVVLFDFDGTLGDTTDLIVRSYHETLAQAGLPARSDATVRSWIGRPLQDCFEQTYPGRGAELTAIYREWNLANHDAMIGGFDGMAALLDALAEADVRTGVVSSKTAATVQRGLDVLGLAGRTQVLAGLHETERHKPEPDPLLYAAGRLGAPTNSCVYVGDAVVDVQAARAAGMSSVAVTWGAGVRAELVAAGPDAIADDVIELTHILFA